jgi:tetratricopeptide (TPR) repeat protein
LVQPSEALRHLQPARRHFEQAGDEWMAVEALDWESAALGLLDDPEAIGIAIEALERCRRLDPKPTQTEARILGHIANMHVIAHSWAQAVRYYEAAVVAAGDVKDLLLEAKMHHGLGLALHQTLNPSEARRHFNKALALYSIEADASAVYRVENDLGWLLLEEGQLESAETHLLRALKGADELQINRRGRGFTLNNLGDLCLRCERFHEAREYLAQALEAGQATGEGIVQASTHELLGVLAEVQRDAEAANREFAIAFAILDEIGMPDRLRDLHMRYAEIVQARGDIAEAARHWKRAAELGKQAASGLYPVASTGREQAGA